MQSLPSAVLHEQPDDIKGLSTINACADKVVTSPTWREPMKKRRCLIPAGWIYEWLQGGKPPKQPYVLEMSNGNLFAIAGLWDAWKDDAGHWLQSLYAWEQPHLF